MKKPKQPNPKQLKQLSIVQQEKKEGNSYFWFIVALLVIIVSFGIGIFIIDKNSKDKLRDVQKNCTKSTTITFSPLSPSSLSLNTCPTFTPGPACPIPTPLPSCPTITPRPACPPTCTPAPSCRICTDCPTISPSSSIGTLPATGRYVILKRIDNSFVKPINIARIQIYETSSSTTPYSGYSGYTFPIYPDSTYQNGAPAANALDSDDTTIAHTNQHPFAFIFFDLGSNRQIGKIIITNRTDCCQSRIVGCAITIQNENQTLIYSRAISSEASSYTFS